MKDLCLFYQPRLDVATGRFTGAEALIRWDHPAHGLLTPAEFLPLASPALAADIDVWMLQTVCRDIQSWQAAGLPPVRVSVQISSPHWEKNGAMEQLLAIIAQSGLHAKYRGVEVEESAIIHYGGGDCDMLSRVRETGIELHLGNASSLKLLARSPQTAIHIDRCQITEMDRQQQRGIVLQAFLALGNQPGMKLVAEGVESTSPQVALTAQQSGDIEGIVMSNPLPAPDFFQWMGKRQTA